MNTFVYGFDNNSKFVINKLKEDCIIDPKVWIVDSKIVESNQLIMTSFGHLDNFHEIYFDKIKEYTEDVDFNFEVYNKVYKKLLHYVNCESRYEKHSLKPFFYYVNKFNLLFRFTYAMFVKEKIELCLFSNLNHEGWDVIIYNVAKALNIKTILLSQSSIPDNYDRIFYVEDLEDFGNFGDMKKTYNQEEFKIRQIQSKDLFYMKNVNKKTFKEFRHLFPLYRKYRKYRKYKKELNRLITPVNYDAKYVYFALHLQPELTTSCLGGKYCDQLLALENLSKIIPDNWKIYLKENPKQNEHMRDYLFFERIKLLKNVFVVPLQENSLKLVLNSQFVATITGTVGYEALCSEKPCLVFGNAWYQKIAGAFKYSDNFDINDILEYKVNLKKTQKDLNNLLSKMPYGVIDEEYIPAIKNYDEKKSMESIYSLLKDLIV